MPDITAVVNKTVSIVSNAFVSKNAPIGAPTNKYYRTIPFSLIITSLEKSENTNLRKKNCKIEPKPNAANGTSGY